ncbi:hypothetical protein TIFTF001_026452 [Ficus carica]|uniref:Dirigent protein n=1 Tax=Ficus carica TaxID=3494 RepID=A0AA88DL78_FICCA|nr:hypothetical protein TIFTF001_026452 [Ficus carica]
MAKLPSKASPCLIFLFISMVINQSSSTRTLGNSTPNHHRQNHHYNTNHKITFLMKDIFNITTTKLTSTSTTHNKLPFSKPLGLVPPKGATLLPETDINPATIGSSSPQTLDLPEIGLSFPAKATLQELEFGIVTSIEENIYHPLGYETYGSQLLGKAQGMHVASSEDGSSHMMALTVKFARDEKGGTRVENGLRFFGVKRRDVSESHIAVIGGIGKYQGANGYATVNVVNVKPGSVLREEKGVGKLLKFNVFLS